MPTFIPGWQCTFSANGQDLTVVANTLELARTKGSQPKPVFGQAFRNEIPGQASGTITANGHLSVEEVGALEGIFDATSAVTYDIQAGTLAAPTDAGSWAGNMVVTEYAITTDAEGEWEWSLAATLDGAPTYTAPTP